MQEWAPGYLQTFLEKIIAGRGVSLRELAVFAATLEDLIHKEEKGHLLQALRGPMGSELDGISFVLHGCCCVVFVHDSEQTVNE